MLIYIDFFPFGWGNNMIVVSNWLCAYKQLEKLFNGFFNAAVDDVTCPVWRQ